MERCATSHCSRASDLRGFEVEEDDRDVRSLWRCRREGSELTVFFSYARNASTSRDRKGTSAWKVQYVPDDRLVLKIKEQASEDCKRASHPNVNDPFEDLEDACERLFPYHVYLSEEAEEADYDETEALNLGRLVMSRRQAWKNLCVRKVNEFAHKLEAQISRLESFERRMNPALELCTEEKLYVERLLLEDEKVRFAEVRKTIEEEKKASDARALAHSISAQLNSQLRGNV